VKLLSEQYFCAQSQPDFLRGWILCVAVRSLLAANLKFSPVDFCSARSALGNRCWHRPVLIFAACCFLAEYAAVPSYFSFLRCFGSTVLTAVRPQARAKVYHFSCCFFHPPRGTHHLPLLFRPRVWSERPGAEQGHRPGSLAPVVKFATASESLPLMFSSVFASLTAQTACWISPARVRHL
jgi:hypothetical protein